MPQQYVKRSFDDRFLGALEIRGDSESIFHVGYIARYFLTEWRERKQISESDPASQLPDESHTNTGQDQPTNSDENQPSNTTELGLIEEGKASSGDEIDEVAAAMEAMGLPVNFGKVTKKQKGKKRKSNGNDYTNKPKTNGVTRVAKPVLQPDVRHTALGQPSNCEESNETAHLKETCEPNHYDKVKAPTHCSAVNHKEATFETCNDPDPDPVESNHYDAAESDDDSGPEELSSKMPDPEESARRLRLLGLAADQSLLRDSRVFLQHKRRKIRAWNKSLDFRRFVDDDGDVAAAATDSGVCVSETAPVIDGDGYGKFCENPDGAVSGSVSMPNYVDEGEHPNEIKNSPGLRKYWAQRYRLFSLFDEGCQLDEESWFSVTPERIARHHANRCRADVVVDAFCGCGGDAIQLALTCEHVIAIDMDPTRLAMAANNAAVYGVADRIQFICGDFLAVAPTLKADCVYLSPPWGGPEYLSKPRYDLQADMPIDINELFAAARAVSDNIAFFAPRNTDAAQLTALAGNKQPCEIEQNFVNRKLKTITAYYGDLVHRNVWDLHEQCYPGEEEEPLYDHTIYDKY